MYRHLLAQLFSYVSLINRGAATRCAGIIFVATFLSGCGNKGALYLPEDVATSYQKQTAQTPDNQLLANQNKD
ncbi:MAG: lipoprotein [Porticoccaceae bacterium]|jgi:predicted small lipoprotein YifL|nr:lipoprotein [Porticoccaceae bacterium]